MEKFFNPESMVIFGLSSKKNNIPGYILQNTLRWGYKGKIFGVTPGAAGEEVHGVPVYGSLQELPLIPDLAVMLIPARFVPLAMEECGKFGIRRAAVLAGGFNETGGGGDDLAREVQEIAAKHGIRFMGPNGLAVSDAHSGVCLPFVPHKKMQPGGFSLITQSGGLCLILWNLMHDENVGMAKFASIGNKLNIDEADMLEYLGQDPRTEVIGLYLESVKSGERLVRAAEKITKPIIALKANTTGAGSRAAMSHTASMSNDDDVVSAAFERAGIIRVNHFHEFIAAAKIFSLPPMRGNRLMIMTPGGGAAVMMADLCEKYGFEFADPGEAFYEKLNSYTNAGVIRFSNPLDMGDIYNIQAYPDIFRDVLSSENVDGAIYGHALPLLPEEDEGIFKKMFYTDISAETRKVIIETGKPLGVSINASAETHVKINRRFGFPVFSRAEELIRALRIQSDFYARQDERRYYANEPRGMDFSRMEEWMNSRTGDVGEEMLELMAHAGITVPRSRMASTPEEAVASAREVGYPVVMKVISPDVLHKSDAGGVVTGLRNDGETAAAFSRILESVASHDSRARIEGVRIASMAPEGQDMFVGALQDAAFGPVVVFGYGGIYTEVFRDIERVLCPASRQEIERKLERLKCHAILKGARGRGRYDIEALVDIIERVSHIAAVYPEIREMDLNPVRIFPEGQGAMALDARSRIAVSREKVLPEEKAGRETLCCQPGA